MNFITVTVPLEYASIKFVNRGIIVLKKANRSVEKQILE